jgi:site-specific DNA-methyltransferase (adenine-specific)
MPASTQIGFHAKKGLGEQFRSNSDGYKNGIRRDSDVISVGVGKCDRSRYNKHSAQYPVELPERLIKGLCPPAGLVLDPFLGSGTTAVAALKCGRQYVGIEKELNYAQIAERRIAEWRATRA